MINRKGMYVRAF